MQHAPTIRPSLHAHDGRRKYVSGQERSRFMAAAASWPDARTATFCLVIAYTGCRISEALAITAAALDTDQKLLAIRSLKKRGAFVVREIPLPDALVMHLASTFDLADKSRRLWPLSRSCAWAHIKRVMCAAGIVGGPHATPKALRHGFAVHALRSGVPITLVKRWLGHARLSTTELYLDVIGPEERAFAERMWR